MNSILKILEKNDRDIFFSIVYFESAGDAIYGFSYEWLIKSQSHSNLNHLALRNKQTRRSFPTNDSKV